MADINEFRTASTSQTAKSSIVAPIAAVQQPSADIRTHRYQNVATLRSGGSGSAATQTGPCSSAIPFLQPRFPASGTSESRIDTVLRLSIISQEARYMQPLRSQGLTGFHPHGIPVFWSTSISILMNIDPETTIESGNGHGLLVQWVLLVLSFFRFGHELSSYRLICSHLLSSALIWPDPRVPESPQQQRILPRPV